MRAAHSWRVLSQLTRACKPSGSCETHHICCNPLSAVQPVQQAPYSAAAPPGSRESKQTNLCTAINDALHIALENDPRYHYAMADIQTVCTVLTKATCVGVHTLSSSARPAVLLAYGVGLCDLLKMAQGPLFWRGCQIWRGLQMHTWLVRALWQRPGVQHTPF